jgi:hypothetical protein
MRQLTRCGTTRYGTTRYRITECETARCESAIARCGTARCETARCESRRRRKFAGRLGHATASGLHKSITWRLSIAPWTSVALVVGAFPLLTVLCRNPRPSTISVVDCK